MTKMDKPTNLSRRAVLMGAGALVVSVGAPLSVETLIGLNSAYAQGTKPPLTPDQLSSYIAVNADGTVSAFFGKMDMGHGLFVAIGQMVAEELDVPFKAVKVYMGDTATSVNQGGASGSTGIQFGGKQMRMAAAEARRVLLDMAAEKLGTPAAQLIVVNGTVSAAFNRDKKTSYAELIGGKYFNVQLDWNKQMGNALYAPGKAQPKKHTEHKIVGKPIKREDVAPKVFAQEYFVTDIKVPGMVHGRMIRPAVAGQVPVKVDESSIKGIPGAKVVWDKGFLGVVADKEWDAIKAAETLKVEWSQVNPPFPDQTTLYDHIRKAPVRKAQVDKQNGNVDDAFKSAARVIEAEYEWPFQSHACMGPACALIEIKDGKVDCWSGSQKTHFVQLGLAAQLGVPPANVHVRWIPGPGCYGRNDADDCAADCAVLAKAVGKAVRLQYSRNEGTGWDPKGPASVHKARAAIDAQGNVIAYEFMSKGFSRIDVNTNGSRLHDTLAGHTLGVELKPGENFGVPAESYEFANKKMGWETIPPLLDRASPLRGAHLRDPVGPQIHFASESFMDEVAAATNQDPIEFRLKHVKDPRDQAVIKAAAQKFGWDTRPSPSRSQTGTKVAGRGIAYSQRNGTKVAVIAQVEVDRTTGKIWAKKFTVAHDCGQIINPDGLEKCIEGNIIQGISRTLWEEVKFDNKSVTSVDWMTYPILDITETPETIDFA
ncbi:MAG TPA: molybdopterin cofactor-binding domain-containing protein, partial [Xanthobacteraceae bacterium]